MDILRFWHINPDQANVGTEDLARRMFLVGRRPSLFWVWGKFETGQSPKAIGGFHKIKRLFAACGNRPFYPYLYQYGRVFDRRELYKFLIFSISKTYKHEIGHRLETPVSCAFYRKYTPLYLPKVHSFLLKVHGKKSISTESTQASIW